MGPIGELERNGEPWTSSLVGYVLDKRPAYLPFHRTRENLWMPKGNLDIFSPEHGLFILKIIYPEDLSEKSKKVIGLEASRLRINGPWITKSYLEMILESKGLPRLNTPPPLSSALLKGNQERTIFAPKPIRVSSNIVNKFEDLTQPWTRSPTKSDMDAVVRSWKFVADSAASTGNIELVPMPDARSSAQRCIKCNQFSKTTQRRQAATMRLQKTYFPCIHTVIQRKEDPNLCTGTAMHNSVVYRTHSQGFVHVTAMLCNCA